MMASVSEALQSAGQQRRSSQTAWGRAMAAAKNAPLLDGQDKPKPPQFSSGAASSAKLPLSERFTLAATKNKEAAEQEQARFRAERELRAQAEAVSRTEKLSGVMASRGGKPPVVTAVSAHPTENAWLSSHSSSHSSHLHLYVALRPPSHFLSV